MGRPRECRAGDRPLLAVDAKRFADTVEIVRQARAAGLPLRLHIAGRPDRNRRDEAQRVRDLVASAGPWVAARRSPAPSCWASPGASATGCTRCTTSRSGSRSPSSPAPAASCSPTAAGASRRRSSAARSCCSTTRRRPPGSWSRSRATRSARVGCDGAPAAPGPLRQRALRVAAVRALVSEELARCS